MIHRIPKFVQKLLSDYFEFSIPTDKKIIYLTFDDGPVPEVTPKVLDLLDRYDAKATFFCVGDNIRKHMECFERIILRGHATGNHTTHHLKGIISGTKHYLSDTEQSREFHHGNLFRPPYGRLKGKQIRGLQRKGYRLILWSVISYDYNQKISPRRCFKNVSKLRCGDIVLFHDSIKAEKNMLYSLERVLKLYSEKGFRFMAIEQ